MITSDFQEESAQAFLFINTLKKKNNGGELEVWKYIPVTSPATFKDTNRPSGFQYEYFEMLN